jgi:hypothetical protein
VATVTAATTTTAETMTSHVGRLYSIALALFVFFMTWVVIGARPWVASGSPSDPRLTALEQREQRVRRQSVAVQRLVRRRWATYQAQLRQRRSQIAAANQAQAAAAQAPQVRVVSLPPVTSTRTS